MTALEIGLVIIVLVVVAVLIIGMIPDTPMDALRKFREQCRAQGMDFAETEAAVDIRVSFAQLRRMASDQCVARDGQMERKDINEIAGHIAIGLAAAHGQEAAKSFIGWIDSCPDSEILYDDARAARHARNVASLREHGMWPPKNVPMSDDLKNAFKIVKR